MARQRFSVIRGRWAIARLTPSEAVPLWATLDGEFVSITRTPDELSIVCRAAVVPPHVQAERDWTLLAVQGPIPFGEVGVLAALTQPLADAGISLFALSTFDTDYILVKETDAMAACNALITAGHTLVD